MKTNKCITFNYVVDKFKTLYHITKIPYDLGGEYTKIRHETIAKPCILHKDLIEVNFKYWE